MDVLDLADRDFDALGAELVGLHRRTTPGDVSRVMLPTPERIPRQALHDTLTGTGFVTARRFASRPTLLRRQWTLPDTVGPEMALLICGLNPSPAAADKGVGFARPGNRFWPAALSVGLVSRDRDPDHALANHGLGMTDIVKRTTRRADELAPSEYRDGVERLERLCGHWAPRTVCFVGLAGWRAVRDRRATPGWQADELGGRPVYVMPSTSGLNASARLDDLAAHLRSAGSGPA